MAFICKVVCIQELLLTQDSPPVTKEGPAFCGKGMEMENSNETQAHLQGSPFTSYVKCLFSEQADYPDYPGIYI